MTGGSSESGAAQRRAFAERVRPELPAIHGRLRRLGVRESDLEDVTHDVLVHLWQQRAAYDPSRPFGAWTVGFCVKVAANYRRLAAHRLQVACEKEPASEAVSAEEALGQEELRRHLIGYLAALPDEQREMIVLVDLEDMPVPDAAAILGINVNTGYTRLRAGRAELARLVRQGTLLRGER